MKLKLFPLDIVAYPNKFIYLHIFEERYKKLIKQCIKDQSEFGIINNGNRKFADIGCTVSIKKVINQYSDGRLDIVCVGEKLFKLEKKSMLNNLTIGEISYLPELVPIPSSLFEPLKEKYLKIIISLGGVKDLKRHISKKITFELLDMIQLPTFVEQKLISLQSEESRAEVLNKFFTTILEKSSSNNRKKKFTS
ncbi:MAG: hypothetical protein CMG74_05530 [Candidatus Marinimicrobia bacterium]|nr:hypothetical protein [Candidatus Neomarinimicrobiota bacterium]|tara:strand:+ start:31829 stop:32410 length:582 start_codon:yes stop_codon:yes gene_type:complete